MTRGPPRLRPGSLHDSGPSPFLLPPSPWSRSEPTSPQRPISLPFAALTLVSLRAHVPAAAHLPSCCRPHLGLAQSPRPRSGGGGDGGGGFRRPPAINLHRCALLLTGKAAASLLLPRNLRPVRRQAVHDQRRADAVTLQDPTQLRCRQGAQREARLLCTAVFAVFVWWGGGGCAKKLSIRSLPETPIHQASPRSLPPLPPPLPSPLPSPGDDELQQCPQVLRLHQPPAPLQQHCPESLQPLAQLRLTGLRGGWGEMG